MRHRACVWTKRTPEGAGVGPYRYRSPLHPTHFEPSCIELLVHTLKRPQVELVSEFVGAESALAWNAYHECRAGVF